MGFGAYSFPKFYVVHIMVIALANVSVALCVGPSVQTPAGPPSLTFDL